MSDTDGKGKEFSYVIPPGKRSLRPQVPVEIFYGGRNKPAMGLVDSGGDITLIDQDIAESLGVVLDDCEESTMGNVVMTDIKVRLAKIRIRIEGFDEDFIVKARLVPDMALEVILGDDIFKEFKITFERIRHKFYMKRE